MIKGATNSNYYFIKSLISDKSLIYKSVNLIKRKIEVEVFVD